MGEQGAAAGHEFEPYPVAWLKRDVLLFANSIGCRVDELQFLYVSARHGLMQRKVADSTVGKTSELLSLSYIPNPSTIQA